MNKVPSLFKQLNQRGLIQATLPTNAQEPALPWYMKVFMGICGWVAAIFCLAFLFLAIGEYFDSLLLALLLGLIFIVFAYYVLSSANSEFAEHLGLATSLTGQGLITFGLVSNWASETDVVAAMLLIMQCLLAYQIPSFIHRVMSGYLATLCLVVILREWQLISFYSPIVMLIAGFIWLNEFNLSRQVKAVQAIGYGIVLGLIQFETSALLMRGQTWQVEQLADFNPWLDESLNVGVLLYVIYRLVQQGKLLTTHFSRGISFFLLILLCTGTMFANGIALGVMIILIGFAISNRALLCIGITGTIINLSSYYYFLDISFLNKSLLLISLGGLALILSFALHKSADKEALDND